MRKMEKRGATSTYLGEETLKVVVSLLAIGILAFLLFSIYNAVTSSKSLDQAKATLPALVTASVAGQTSFDVYNPGDWFLMSFSNSDLVPKSCSTVGLKACICICQGDTAESCDSKNEGICTDNRGFFVIGGPIPISNPPLTLRINQQNKLISKK